MNELLQQLAKKDAGLHTYNMHNYQCSFEQFNLFQFNFNLFQQCNKMMQNFTGLEKRKYCFTGATNPIFPNWQFFF